MKRQLPSSISHAPRSKTLPGIFSRTVLLHEIFEAQADLRPEAVAVSDGREEVTYAGLEARANRLARYLRGRGVGRGSAVGLLLPRSADAYAAILAILKAGAAYVPIDPEYPQERATFILENSRAAALVTNAELASRAPEFGGEVIRVDADRAAIAAESAARLEPGEAGVGPLDLCYIIYTSGSTGRPKGVMIEHRNARHLVRAEGRIYGVRPDDRVYQGASLAFDLSVEEIWLAFHAGATLIPATPQMVHAGPDLSRLLTERGVTVLSAVPTLLSMLAEDIPTLRVLIFGGEACPDWMVARWARRGRTLFNTYGPTETTVIATFAVLSPEKPVTIGRPVPGYRVYILDDKLQLAPRGQVGEICIGGAGVARGYVGLPEQTAARFVPDPFAPPGEPDARIYRSGDLGRINSEGNLEFMGRADAQVKLRGFRIELSEIESVLLEQSEILAAACTVREDTPGVQHLVGYVVPRDGNAIDEERLRSHLRTRLPAYMVPAMIETVSDLPRLASGKLDRTRLPAPGKRQAPRVKSAQRPQTPSERRIARVWEKIFHPQPVSLDEDFFLDLGGHSLLAARMVSELRKDPQFARVSVADVYERPTIASLAAALDAVAPCAESSAWHRAGGASRKHDRPGNRARHFGAGLLQSAGLYFVFGANALEWVTPYLVFMMLLASGHSVLNAAAWGMASAMAVFPLLTVGVIAAKWLVLGRVRPGRYPLWGAYYLRWWFAQTLIKAVPLNYLAGTPLLPFVYRLLGARIGKDVHLDSDGLAAFDLISIGDGSSIDGAALLLGYTVEEETLIIGPVTVGRNCFVGTRAVLRAGCVMEDGARLDDLSFLPAGARIPRGETWKGSPARRVDLKDPVPPPRPRRGRLERAALAALYAGLVVVFPIVLISAVVPGMALLLRIDPLVHPLEYLAAAPLVGASFVLFLTVETVALKWLLAGRVRPGTYPVHGRFYIRKWIVDKLLALSLDIIGPIHATLYLAPWYRALGAKLGRLVELSTATSTTPDLLELGDGCTIADEVSLGSPRIERGWMTLARTRLDRRVFLGNSAVIPAGVEMGEGSLVGVLSIAPSDRAEAAKTHTSWLGSPARLLPRRQPSAGFCEERTYSPPRKLLRARRAFELLRVTLPPAGFVIVSATVIEAALLMWPRVGLGATLALLPLVYAACCVAVILGVALAKWTLVGRFKPFARPLWSNFIWRLELQNALYEFLATPLALEALRGTPFLPWYFRLLGAKIGRRVYVHTTGLLEFDLIEVGDRAALNDDCVLQTHLFEDRVLKASTLRIGADCSVGAVSVVLYDSKMEDGAKLDALSLLMKGETLPAGTAWAGIPAAWQEKPGPTRVPERDSRNTVTALRERFQSDGDVVEAPRAA